MLWLQDQAEWLGSALAAALNIAVPKLRRGVLFWVNQGVAKITCSSWDTPSCCLLPESPTSSQKGTKGQAADFAESLAALTGVLPLQAARHMIACNVCRQDLLSRPCCKSHGCFWVPAEDGNRLAACALTGILLLQPLTYLFFAVCRTCRAVPAASHKGASTFQWRTSSS